MYRIWSKWFIRSVSLEKKESMPPNNEQSLQNSIEYLTGTLKSPWVTGDCRSEDPQTLPAQWHMIRNSRHVLFLSCAVSHDIAICQIGEFQRLKLCLMAKGFVAVV